ncbi:hypothetical protein Agub_g4714, partial [Astrephomene gubernaculifera]
RMGAGAAGGEGLGNGRPASPLPSPARSSLSGAAALSGKQQRPRSLSAKPLAAAAAASTAPPRHQQQQPPHPHPANRRGTGAAAAAGGKSSAAGRGPGGSRLPFPGSPVGSPSVDGATDLSTLVCELCSGGHREDQILLCDRCDRGFHLFCLTPPLSAVPEGEWVCPLCRRAREEAAARAEEGGELRFAEFERQAMQVRRQHLGKESKSRRFGWEEVEAEFWRIVEEGGEQVEVLTAGELDGRVYGSGFPRYDTRPGSASSYYAAHPGNLNNLPKLEGSLLGHLPFPLPGLTSPVLHVNMLFSATPWHLPDHMLLSASYLHMGEPRRCYGVPYSHLGAFEQLVMREASAVSASTGSETADAGAGAAAAPTLPDLLGSTFARQRQQQQHQAGSEGRAGLAAAAPAAAPVMLSPRALMRARVTVYGVTQGPGELVVSWPGACMAGFSAGLGVVEEVRFATPHWVGWATEAEARYRRALRQPLFSYHELVVRLMAAAKPTRELSLALGTHLLWLTAGTLETRLELWGQGVVRSRQVPASTRSMRPPTAQLPTANNPRNSSNPSSNDNNNTADNSTLIAAANGGGRAGLSTRRRRSPRPSTDSAVADLLALASSCASAAARRGAGGSRGTSSGAIAAAATRHSSLASLSPPNEEEDEEHHHDGGVAAAAAAADDDDDVVDHDDDDAVEDAAAAGGGGGGGPDEYDSCVTCRALLFLTAVECDCCPGRFACATHAAALCGCAPAARRMVYRTTVRDWEEMQDGLNAGALGAPRGAPRVDAVLMYGSDAVVPRRRTSDAGGEEEAPAAARGAAAAMEGEPPQQRSRAPHAANAVTAGAADSHADDGGSPGPAAQLPGAAAGDADAAATVAATMGAAGGTVLAPAAADMKPEAEAEAGGKQPEMDGAEVPGCNSGGGGGGVCELVSHAGPSASAGAGDGKEVAEAKGQQGASLGQVISLHAAACAAWVASARALLAGSGSSSSS